MANLFIQNQPETSSPLKSSIIRDNFEALYDKLKVLEVRASTPITTLLTVTGGPVYFRSQIENKLKLINFQTKVIDILNITSYKTVDGYEGALLRVKNSQVGPSAFETEGLYLEVLLSLNDMSELIITESKVAQNNELSSPFNIYFDDSEIPIALILLKKSNTGVLQPIDQTAINDIRPFITTAFQNISQTADLESQINDNTLRIDQIEPAIKITSNGLVKLPSEAKLIADGIELTNTKIEITSASGLIDGYGRSLNFAGGFVDFTIGSVDNTDTRTFTAGTSLSANTWNKALISLQYDPTGINENAKPIITHGTPADPLSSFSVEPTSPVGTIPLSKILYRMDSTSVRPINLDYDQNTSTQLNYELPITGLTEISNLAYLAFDIDITSITSDRSQIFELNSFIDISDDNTRSFRRKIVGRVLNGDILSITVNETFADISLNRNPKAKSLSTKKHIYVIEDVRPFIGTIGTKLI